MSAVRRLRPHPGPLPQERVGLLAASVQSLIGGLIQRKNDRSFLSQASSKHSVLDIWSGPGTVFGRNPFHAVIACDRNGFQWRINPEKRPRPRNEWIFFDDA